MEHRRWKTVYDIKDNLLGVIDEALLRRSTTKQTRNYKSLKKTIAELFFSTDIFTSTLDRNYLDGRLVIDVKCYEHRCAALCEGCTLKRAPF